MQSTSDSPFNTVMGLGPKQTEHPVSNKNRWGNLTFGLLCLAATPILLGLTIYFYLDTVNRFGASRVDNRLLDIFWPLGVAVVFLPLGLWALFNVWRNWGVSAALYENGLAYNDRTGLRQIRWDQVDGVWQQVTKHYYNGIYTGTTHLYTLQTSDGQKMKFDDKFAKVEELGTGIQKYVSNALYPRYVQALNNGQKVTFGPLAIDREGIYNGNKSLKWAEIKAVKIQSGTISIKKEGGWFNWASVSVPQVPNFWIFYELVSRLTKVE
jgi:hypothetical protein